MEIVELTAISSRLGTQVAERFGFGWLGEYVTRFRIAVVESMATLWKCIFWGANRDEETAYLGVPNRPSVACCPWKVVLPTGQRAMQRP